MHRVRADSGRIDVHASNELACARVCLIVRDYRKPTQGTVKSMLALRSLVFSILFYGYFALSAVAAAGISLVSPGSLPPFARFWSRTWLAMYRAVCGVSYEVRGLENVPRGGCLLAIKHQSVWDTCALFAIFERPVFVLKSELMYIPFFGWALARLGCIPVKRGTGRSALDNMVRGTQIALAQDKQVVIFPEGTRTMLGQPANYKTGISHLYTALNVACIPVALNSGAYWPRHSFLRPPGVIRFEVLPAIPAGLDRKEMFDLLVEKIETASARLN
jgi:1-acyl-sn-glycerol-3-phosphate acyltransferase